MKLSNQEFFRTYDILRSHCEKKAEEASLYPDLPKRIWISDCFVRNANEALAVLAALPLVCPSTRNYDLISDLRQHIAKMASTYRYEGQWKIVAEILSTTDSMVIDPTWNLITENMSKEDWFGNFVPKLVQAIKALRWQKVYHSVVEDTRPYHRPQRKRGYNDKGSSRPNHKWLPRYAYAREDSFYLTVKEPLPFRWYHSYRKRRS